MLGLDRGDFCNGVAFRIAPENFDSVLDYLRRRELVTHVYLETSQTIVLEDGSTVKAITYIVDQEHEQYAGRLEFEPLMKQIRGAVGQSGANEDYFLETARHLAELGISDPLMEQIAGELQSSQHPRTSV